jgi:tRNA (cmo5U34)-methyltransferase
MTTDNLYALPLSRVGDFAFDEQVVRVFPDMISRSVPGYASVLSMIEQLAARFLKPDTTAWDLGCSLGAGTVLIRRRLPSGCVLHAVDNSAAMIARLTDILADAPAGSGAVEVHAADLRAVEIANASLVVLNWTLQFIPAADRAGVLRKIADGMVAGGGLLLSEKICFEEPAAQQLLTDLHHDFKRANGYSDLEIAQKRTALENTLIPETLATHIDRLRDAGFSVAVPWFQCFNFASVLAVK